MDPDSAIKEQQKLVAFQISTALESLVLTMSPLICGAEKCGWEKMDSKCFFFHLKASSGADAGSPCADRLWILPAQWFILERGFSGRLRTLRQPNNRCSLPADGATCLDFHTYTSWWSNHQPEVATLQKLCSLITTVVCTGWVESNQLTSEVLKKFAQMSVLYRLIFIDSQSHLSLKAGDKRGTENFLLHLFEPTLSKSSQQYNSRIHPSIFKQINVQKNLTTSSIKTCQP